MLISLQTEYKLAETDTATATAVANAAKSMVIFRYLLSPLLFANQGSKSSISVSVTMVFFWRQRASGEPASGEPTSPTAVSTSPTFLSSGFNAREADCRAVVDRHADVLIDMINRFGLQDKDAFAEDFLKKLKTPLKESQERPSGTRWP